MRRMLHPIEDGVGQGRVVQVGDMEGEAYVYALRDRHETPLETARKLAREGIRKNRLTQLSLGVGSVLSAMALALLSSWLIGHLYRPQLMRSLELIMGGQ